MSPSIGSKSERSELSIYPHYDYLADIQDNLTQIDGNGDCLLLPLPLPKRL